MIWGGLLLLLLRKRKIGRCWMKIQQTRLVIPLDGARIEEERDSEITSRREEKN